MIRSAHVIFDLDGTLTDPKPGITRCIAYALEKMGCAVPELDSLTWCIGPPLPDSFPKLLGRDDADDVAKAVALYRERFADVGLYENEVYAGIPEALAGLASHGCSLYVATSKPLVYASRILDHFGLTRFFSGVYGSELDGTRSNKADLLRFVVEQENLSPVQATMIGDRRHDILGAKANGLHSIGVLYGYGTQEELSEAGADALCETPDGLVKSL